VTPVILLTDVTDNPVVFGVKQSLLEDANLLLPQGRYALLSRSPELHRVLIDVLAGLRPPEEGYVRHEGLISWPIGRMGFSRGRLKGIDIIKFICSLYGINHRQCSDFVQDILSNPEYVDMPMDTWPPYVRQEFLFALALVPPFDIYVIDAAIPFEPSRFTRLWQALFEDIIVGKTLILATYRREQLTDYCSKGLIYENRGFRIDEDIDSCLDRYPIRQSRAESASGAGGTGGLDPFLGGGGADFDF
jgi:capsular polysaccharide transport system ATP-binding protein